MNIVRHRRDGAVALGVSGGMDVIRLSVESLAELWTLSLPELRTLLDHPARGERTALSAVEFLAPVDGLTDAWAAGVTYQTSRGARIEESERAASVDELAYGAVRPEIFLTRRAEGPVMLSSRC